MLQRTVHCQLFTVHCIPEECMELSQLETFLAVAEERSFSRAALRLHRTQPAVSQVIRKLEASVGETLFDRASRDGSLTAAGVLLRDSALRLVALRREVIEAFQRYRTPLNMGIELPTIEAIKRFVAMGNGVALVPHLTVVHELESGDLVQITVDELEMKRVLRLVHRRKTTLSYAARAFLRTVRTMAQEQGP